MGFRACPLRVKVPYQNGFRYMEDCQNYGPFLGPYYNTGPHTGPNLGDPKRDHNFDKPPHTMKSSDYSSGDLKLQH